MRNLKLFFASLFSLVSLHAADLHDSKLVPPEIIQVPEGLEVTVWATSPMLHNPTNMDVDYKGRIWVAEGRKYRLFRKNSWVPKTDRIVVMEDTNKDGKADKHWTFVEDEELIAPLGVAVIGNKVIVAQPPNLIVYTDVNENAVFDKGIDKKEILLTGWGGNDHDHSLHSVTVGPNGQWYMNTGNAGNPDVKGSDGFHLIAGSSYSGGKKKIGRKSSDGFAYIGGLAIRMNPDGSGIRVIGHNFRNSYEQTVTSIGDVFQNDNDDPPAARTSYLMEYSDMGYAKEGGSTSWKRAQRFNFDMTEKQSTAVAEWGQDNPGIAPAGDVYGGGSPTGIAYYENGIMEDQWKGLLVSCEPARNVIFGYKPQAQGAGFKLSRTDFMTTAPAKFKGGDFNGGGKNIGSDMKNLFRPSDVCIGADGAIYVADWFDTRVGGHQTFDKNMYGTIYRIAPKGFKPSIPKYDFNSISGLIEVLKSPAVNVRAIGFYGLKEKGEAAIPAVIKLLQDQNEYIQARAIWLLAQLGEKGISEAKKLLDNKDVKVRTTAFRALRFIEHDLINMAVKMAKDVSPAIRREVALAMRTIPATQSKDILVEMIKRWDGKDRHYLEAFGYGSDNKTTEIYQAVKSSTSWDTNMTMIAWRLHPAVAVNDLKKVALDSNIDRLERYRAIDGIAFTKSIIAYKVMQEIVAKTAGKFQERAKYWLSYNSKASWKPFAGKLIFTYTDSLIPVLKTAAVKIADVLALKGDAKDGKRKAAACQMCHQINGSGVEFGPILSNWGKSQPMEIIIKAIVDPKADIAHGYKASEIKTTDGKTIQGFIIADGEIVSMRIMGGGTVDINAEDIASRKELKESAMIAGQTLGLSKQDIRNIAEYLKRN
jgi:putative membrane-bound dehydrogenase-like protein